MRPPTGVEPSPSPRQPPTAHARFRAGDRSRVSAGVVLSVLLHLVLVLAWPELTPPADDAGRSSPASPLELVSLDRVRPPGAGLAAVPLVQQEGEEEEEAEEDEPPPDRADGEDREAPDGAAGGAAPGGDRRTDAMERIAGVTPRVLRRRPLPPTDPPPVRPVDDRAADRPEREGEDVRIRGPSSDPGERLTEGERMKLERLSSVRPRLAFGSPSSWLVVENPRAVREFMRRRFPRTSAAGTGGAISVSLWVDERGSVQWAEIDRSSGDPELDASALELFEEVIAFGPARERRLDVPTAAVFWLSW